MNEAHMLGGKYTMIDEMKVDRWMEIELWTSGNHSAKAPNAL